jgi:hypothetical protein
MVRNPPPPQPRNFYGTVRQPMKLIFGMQPYFDPTRKTTSQKNGNYFKTNEKWKTTSKKMEDYLNFKAVLLSLFNN